MSAPYYSDGLVTLYLGKHEDILPTLDVTFDLIVADPPYGETSLDWDRWPDGWPALVSNYARSMWCFGSLRMFMQHATEFGAWKLSQDVHDVQDVVMEKHNGSSLSRDRFRRVHEQAAFFYQGPWGDVYIDVPTTADAAPRTVRRKALPPQHQGARGPSVYRSEDSGPRLMRSVIRTRSMHGSAINETEKNPAFVEILIQSACQPGGIVLDPFGGSCSTAIAARAIGRRAVCIERRESQCEKAAKRLAQGVLDFGTPA